MALIQCPTCGHSISDKATRCPKCGRVVGPQMQQTSPYNAGAYPVEDRNSGNKGRKTGIIIVSVVAAILAIVVVGLVIHINNKPSYSSDLYDEVYESPVEEEVDDTETEVSSSSTLEQALREVNQTLPETIDEGIVMEKIKLEGDYVVYYYTMDEDYYSIDIIRNNKSEMKKAMKDEFLNTTDSDVRLFMSICKENHKGIATRYQGSDSGDSYTIYISPSEL